MSEINFSQGFNPDVADRLFTGLLDEQIDGLANQGTSLDEIRSQIPTIRKDVLEFIRFKISKDAEWDVNDVDSALLSIGVPEQELRDTTVRRANRIRAAEIERLNLIQEKQAILGQSQTLAPGPFQPITFSSRQLSDKQKERLVEIEAQLGQPESKSMAILEQAMDKFLSPGGLFGFQETKSFLLTSPTIGPFDNPAFRPEAAELKETDPAAYNAALVRNEDRYGPGLAYDMPGTGLLMTVPGMKRWWANFLMEDLLDPYTYALAPLGGPILYEGGKFAVKGTAKSGRVLVRWTKAMTAPEDLDDIGLKGLEAIRREEELFLQSFFAEGRGAPFHRAEAATPVKASLKVFETGGTSKITQRRLRPFGPHPEAGFQLTPEAEDVLKAGSKAARIGTDFDLLRKMEKSILKTVKEVSDFEDPYLLESFIQERMRLIHTPEQLRAFEEVWLSDKTMKTLIPKSWFNRERLTRTFYDQVNFRPIKVSAGITTDLTTNPLKYVKMSAPDEFGERRVLGWATKKGSKKPNKRARALISSLKRSHPKKDPLKMAEKLLSDEVVPLPSNPIFESIVKPIVEMTAKDSKQIQDLNPLFGTWTIRGKKVPGGKTLGGFLRRNVRTPEGAVQGSGLSQVVTQASNMASQSFAYAQLKMAMALGGRPVDLGFDELGTLLGQSGRFVLARKPAKGLGRLNPFRGTGVEPAAKKALKDLDGRDFELMTRVTMRGIPGAASIVNQARTARGLKPIYRNLSDYRKAVKAGAPKLAKDEWINLSKETGELADDATKMGMNVADVFSDVNKIALKHSIMTPNEFLQEFLPKLLRLKELGDIPGRKVKSPQLISAFKRSVSQDDYIRARSTPFLRMIEDGSLDLDNLNIVDIHKQYTRQLFKEVFIRPMIKEASQYVLSPGAARVMGRRVQLASIDFLRAQSGEFGTKVGISQMLGRTLRQSDLLTDPALRKEMYGELADEFFGDPDEHHKMTIKIARLHAQAFHLLWVGGRLGLAFRNWNQKFQGYSLATRGLSLADQAELGIKAAGRWVDDDVTRQGYYRLSQRQGWNSFYTDFLQGEMREITQGVSETLRRGSMFAFQGADLNNRTHLYSFAAEAMDMYVADAARGGTAWRKQAQAMRTTERAAFIKAMEAGDQSRALDALATFTINNSQWLYHPTNRPIWAQGNSLRSALLSYLYLFKSWPLNYAEALAHAGARNAASVQRGGNAGRLLKGWNAFTGVWDYMLPPMITDMALGRAANRNFGVDVQGWMAADTPNTVRSWFGATEDDLENRQRIRIGPEGLALTPRIQPFLPPASSAEVDDALTSILPIQYRSIKGAGELLLTADTQRKKQQAWNQIFKGAPSALGARTAGEAIGGQLTQAGILNEDIEERNLFQKIIWAGLQMPEEGSRRAELPVLQRFIQDSGFRLPQEEQ